MAIRVIAVFDVGVPASQREQLSGRLTEALKTRPSELEALGFKPAALDQSTWTWDWNPDTDGDFQTWLTRNTVGLSWPDSSGIAVHCSNHATQVATGVRWDIVNQDGGIREAVTKVVLVIGRSIGAKEAWLIPDAGDAAASKVLDMVFEDAPSSELAAMIKRSTAVHALRC